MATTSVTRNRPPWPKNLSCVAAQRPEVPFRFNVEFDVFEEEKNFNTNVHAQICILRFRFSIGYLLFIIKNILEQRSLQEKFNNLVNGAGLRGGRLTSLDASFMRCFVFFQTSSKTSRSMFFFKTLLIHRIVKQKVWCFPRCFRFQKGHSESELNKQVRASQS